MNEETSTPCFTDTLCLETLHIIWNTPSQALQPHNDEVLLAFEKLRNLAIASKYRLGG